MNAVNPVNASNALNFVNGSNALNALKRSTGNIVSNRRIKRKLNNMADACLKFKL